MENQVRTIKMIRRRRFLLVMPLLVLPFLTVLFWSLGGGKMKKAQAHSVEQAGFNVKLPDANLMEDKSMDKLGYYDKAKMDSLKFQELIKNDPDYLAMAYPDSSQQAFSGKKGLNTSLYGNGNLNDPNSEKIYKKLAELNREMGRSTNMDDGDRNSAYTTSGLPSTNTPDAEKLQQMMQMIGKSDGEDPELNQLSGMLEKILDIQHPEMAQEKMKQASQAKRGKVFAVSRKQTKSTVSLIKSKPSGSLANGFYSLDENSAAENNPNAIEAAIHETQTVVNGSTVKLRLINDIFINGTLIPKDNFLFGTASLSGERLEIKINSIRYKNSLFPVELSVYDIDGLDGIYIPGAITRDVAKESADRSVQTIEMSSLDPSWGAQAAGAGIEAAKSLFGKKVKLIKVTVKAGYKVLLYDEKQKQN